MFFLLYINDPTDDVICSVAIYTDDFTFYSKSDQASVSWQQLEFASEFESNDRLKWGRDWSADFSAGKLNLFHVTASNHGAIDLKMDASAVDENYLLSCCDCVCLLIELGLFHFVYC